MGTKERAAKLLGQGVDQSIVATALGVSPSYITQLLEQEQFAAEVTQLRFINLENATGRDSKYDAMEDKFLDKLEEMSPYMTKPREILGALAVLNKAQRRGAKQENQPQVKQDVVVLTLPSVIHNTFITNHANQVIAVSGGSENPEALQRDLSTITAKALLERLSPTTQAQMQAEVQGVTLNGQADRERIPERVGS